MTGRRFYLERAAGGPNCRERPRRSSGGQEGPSVIRDIPTTSSSTEHLRQSGGRRAGPHLHRAVGVAPGHRTALWRIAAAGATHRRRPVRRAASARNAVRGTARLARQLATSEAHLRQSAGPSTTPTSPVRQKGSYCRRLETCGFGVIWMGKSNLASTWARPCSSASSLVGQRPIFSP